MAKAIPPGTPAPDSGQYRPKGGGPERAVPAGHRLPPTPKPGTGWINVDKTKTNPGKGKK